MIARSITGAVLLAAGLVGAGAGADTRGERLAREGNQNGAVACMTCHGQAGEGQGAAGFPYLAGLDQSYLVRQIQAFKTGERINPVMRPIADALTPEETEAVAAYYGGLPLPERGLGPQQLVPRAAGARRLMTRGNWQEAGLPACEACHGPGGRGVGAAFPNIAGQPADYIKAQLEAWRQGQRRNDPQQLMQAVAEKLTVEEVQDVAAYLAAQSPSGEMPQRAQTNPLGAGS